MKRHILLIDEDKNQLKIFMDALIDINGFFKCTYASSTKYALEMLRFFKPDFIFVNYRGSGASYLQSLLGIIKNMKYLEKVKTFVYSEKITEEIKNAVSHLDISGWLEKPDTISKLTHQFKSIFSSDDISTERPLLKKK